MDRSYRKKSKLIYSYAIGLTLDTPIDFAFSPRLKPQIFSFLFLGQRVATIFWWKTYHLVLATVLLFSTIMRPEKKYYLY